MVKIIETSLIEVDNQIIDIQSRVIEVKSWDDYVFYLKGSVPIEYKDIIGVLHGKSLSSRENGNRLSFYSDDHMVNLTFRSREDKDNVIERKLAYRVYHQDDQY